MRKAYGALPVDLAQIVEERGDEEIAVVLAPGAKDLADAVEVGLVEARQPAKSDDLGVGQEMGQVGVSGCGRHRAKGGKALAETVTSGGAGH